MLAALVGGAGRLPVLAGLWDWVRDFDSTLLPGVGGTAALRALDVLADATPGLYVGVVAAIALAASADREDVRRLLKGDRISAPVCGWLLGLLLPVGAFGALLVAASLRRVRAQRGMVAAFLAAAGALNLPTMGHVTMIAGLAATLFLLAATGAVAVAVGMACYEPPREGAGPELVETVPPTLSDVITRPFDQLFGGVGLCVLAGLIGPVLLVVIGPGMDATASLLARPSAMGPLFASGLMLPAYFSSAFAASVAGMFLREHQIYSTPVILVVLGSGITLGTLVWVGAVYGARTFTRFLTVLLLATLVVSWLADASLPRLHSGLFDDYHAFFTLSPVASEFRTAVRPAGRAVDIASEFRNVDQAHVLALGVLAALMLLGTAWRAFSRTARGEIPPERPTPLVRRPLTFGAIYVGAMAVAFVYALYPSPASVIDNMQEAVVQGRLDAEGGKPIRAWAYMRTARRNARQLAICSLLQTGRMDPLLARPARDLAREADLTRRGIEDGQPVEEIRVHTEAMTQAYYLLVRASRPLPRESAEEIARQGQSGAPAGGGAAAGGGESEDEAEDRAGGR